MGLMVALGSAAAGLYLLNTPFFSPQQLDQAGRVCLAAAMAIVLFLGLRRGRERALGGAKRNFDTIQAQQQISELSFEDVAANDEARQSLKGLVDFLKDPEKYQRFGARMPRGVLLYGPPGTGKTLLARALAGEAGVPFFALSGSDFVQMYVGVGAGRVRDLFQKARKAGRCVIFIDEIDAMGKRRDDSASDEREQTLNALLTEMSGFKDEDGVIVLAATNRIDTLDPALLRPGRFDRQIEVGLPGKSQRLSILKLHARNKPLDASVDLEALAADTVLFSGASLETLLNEAAIRAARRGAAAIERPDIEAAYLTSVAGEDKEIGSTSRAELCTIALHEAGHALATHLLMPEHRVSRVSILPSGKGAAGYSLAIPPDRTLLRRDQLEAQVMALLAGRAAELLVGGSEELTSGASSDLSKAAELVSAMVLDLGMAGEPGVALRALSRACGLNPADGLGECRERLNLLFQRVTQLLAEQVDLLMRLTDELLARESLNAAELDKIWENTSVPA